MRVKIYRFIYYKLLGWKTRITVPDYDKYIICVAPHTSNLDLFIGKLFCGAMGRKMLFMMKKEWFVGPLGYIFRRMGGIPVDREKKSALVEQMVNESRIRKTFHLAITPEGTRSLNPNWKKGFYYIALNAQLPIVLVAIDYKQKCIIVEKEIFPCGDIDKDMREIKLYFKDVKGRHPKRFTVGDI